MWESISRADQPMYDSAKGLTNVLVRLLDIIESRRRISGKKSPILDEPNLGLLLRDWPREVPFIEMLY